MKRLVLSALATLLAGSLVGCLDDTPVVPTRGPVRLSLSANIASELARVDRTVGIQAYYLRNNAKIELPTTPSQLTVASGTTTDHLISVNITACLADDQRAGASQGGCALHVDVVLLDNAGEVLSASTQEATVQPGQTVDLPNFTLALPTIVLDATTANFSATEQQSSIPAVQNIHFSSSSAGALGTISTAINYTNGTGWLTAGVDATAGNVTIRPSTTNLAPGTYQAQVTVSSSRQGVPSRTINVSYVVAAAQRRLVIAGGGAGSGLVVSNPTGINCTITNGVASGTCNALFNAGTVVTLTETPGANSSFTSWSEAVCVGPTCNVTLNQGVGVDKTVTVTFAVSPTLTLTLAGAGNGTVTSNPAGINCVRASNANTGTCALQFTNGTQVTLTAAPQSGSSLTGWTGCASNPTQNSCVVTVDQARAVTATFALAPQLTVTLAGNGGGTVTSVPTGINCQRLNLSNTGTCALGFTSGTTVTLVATPNGNSSFASWIGCATNPAPNTCTVLVDQARAVTATFNSFALISGAVLNTQNGSPIVGATVELRIGANTTTGTPLATTTSGVNGTYSFTNLAPNTYTIVARQSGFQEGSVGNIAVNVTPVTGQAIVLSPVVPVGQTRIVLTWNSTPPDLDAHLSGPGPSSSRFFVYWNSPGNAFSDPFATLDIDDQNGNGPETITIVQQKAGVYRFQVHNYSQCFDNSAATPLRSSGARVQVIQSTGVVRDYQVPNISGTLWTVFEMNGSTITTINTVTDQLPDSYGNGSCEFGSASISGARVIGGSATGAGPLKSKLRGSSTGAVRKEFRP